MEMGKEENPNMSRGKKIILEVVILLVFCALVLKAVELWTGVNPLDNIFKRKEALGSIQEVAAALTEKVDGGADGKVTFFIHDIPEEDLKNINYIMSNLNGSVDSFQLHPKLFGLRRIDFTVIRSDNSYVYDAYKNGTPIPGDRVLAQRLLIKVERILKDTISPTMTEYQKELALHDYLVKNCQYGSGSSENDNEFRAYGALIEKEAVCNGYAEAMALLLSCAGVENKYVVGTAYSDRRTISEAEKKDEKRENHAWNQVYVNGTWYHLDATWDDPAGDFEVVSHAYFNMSDELMARDHSWNNEKYNICPDMQWNYFYRERAYFESSSDLDRYVTERVTIQPYGTLECAFGKFELTDFTLSGLSSIPSLSSVQYSTVGNFNFTVLTLYINQ